MVRPIEQEKNTIEKIVYYTHRSQEEGDTPCYGREAHWKHWCWPGNAGVGKVKHGQEPLLCFLWEEWVR